MTLLGEAFLPCLDLDHGNATTGEVGAAFMDEVSKDHFTTGAIIAPASLQGAINLSILAGLSCASAARMYQTWEAQAPTPMPPPKFTGLQQGIIDGQKSLDSSLMMSRGQSIMNTDHVIAP